MQLQWVKVQAQYLIGLRGFDFGGDGEKKTPYFFTSILYIDVVIRAVFRQIGYLIRSSTQGGGNPDTSRPVLWVIGSIKNCLRGG